MAIGYYIGPKDEHYTSLKIKMDWMGHTLKHILPGQLLQNFIMDRPIHILIYLDEAVSHTLELIQAALELYYVPVTCFYEDPLQNKKGESLPDAVFIQYGTLLDAFEPILLHGEKASQKYMTVSQENMAYEGMDESLKMMTIVRNERPENSIDDTIFEWISKLYTEELFTDNAPRIIWQATQFEKTIVAKRYVLDGQNILDYVVQFDKEALNFSQFYETGFYRNFDQTEFGDIASLSQMLPDDMLQYETSCHSFACFAVGNQFLMGLNYEHLITQADLNILKSITMKSDFVKIIWEQMSEIEGAFVYTMNALARAAEGKDEDTGDHIKRVNLFSELIAKALKMPKLFVHQISIAAQMHDIGKINIGDHILLKPGKLTNEEFDEMKKHTIYGQTIIGQSGKLEMAAEIARSHHERYDGTGYPDGLVGDAIPLAARIVFLADIYDALRSKRSYKEGFTHDEAVNIICNGDGRVMPHHFDPQVLTAFKQYHELFNAIFEQ